MLSGHKAMDIDLRRLRTFVTVAECGTVMRAAQLLRITQPALSRQIRGLEQELGFKLFERVGRRLVVTPQGEQFLEDCRNLLAHGRTLAERASALRRGDIRELRVSASALTTEGFFPAFLPLYASRVPDVLLRLIEEDDPARHLDMLERGDVHVSVNVVNNIKVDDARFASLALPPFHVLAACTSSFGLRPADTIDIRQVVEHPLLLPHPSFATRAIFDAACRLASVAMPTPLVQSRAAHALLALAQAGQGLAIVPSVLRPDRLGLNVMAVTHQSKPLRIAVAVLWDRRRTLPRYAEGFADLLASHLREVFPAPLRARASVTGSDTVAPPSSRPGAFRREREARPKTDARAGTS
jgi:DNA-binding transcriptional LysR family regulator